MNGIIYIKKLFTYEVESITKLYVLTELATKFR